jgi:hypothetical protein
MRTAVRVRAEVAVRHRSMVVAGIGGCGQLRLALAATVGRSIPGRYALPCSACDVGSNNVGRVPVQAAAGPVIPHCHRGSASEAASCTSRSGTPASSAAVRNACLSV